MDSWFEERRRDQDATARRRRDNITFEDERSRQQKQQKGEDKQAAKSKRRRERGQRRQQRAQRREKQLTPFNIYRRGTLVLVAVSAAAAIPAQVMYFVKKSLWLLPVPFALEGAAWVMAAGVAYADERKLPAWVRWLLRALCVTAAGFAARINYLHGVTISPTVGWGLAAVTMLGPLFFEVRQWVSTLSAATATPKQQADDRARRRHAKQRHKDHKPVAKLAKKLISAAPYGELSFEDAFTAAWEIEYGTRKPGMTPALHGQLYASKKAFGAALDAANGAPVSVRSRVLELLHPAPDSLHKGIKKLQVVTEIPPSAHGGEKTARKRGWRAPPPHRRSKGDGLPFHPVAKVAAQDTAHKVMTVNGHNHQ